MNINIKLAHGAKIPTYATDGSAGLDLYSSVDLFVSPAWCIRVKTGVFVEIPQGYEGQVRPRSGLLSRGIQAMIGTIDSDYRGEVEVFMHNFAYNNLRVNVGDRIAQIVIAPVVRATLLVVDELSVTARGVSGFGSTGV